MSSKKYNFNGKVALITGSSSGIGAAIAIQFAEYGADLTINGRDPIQLAKIGEEIKKVSGKEPLQLVGDLLQEEFAKKLITETINRFGRFDFLVNNAGATSAGGNFCNSNLMEEYDKVMRLNTRSVIQLSQLSIPYLEQTKGNIVNISSVSGLRPCGIMVYSVSKAALDMVTKCCAKELGPKGVRVNSINPGPVRTRFARFRGVDNADYDSEEYTARTAIGRVGESVEVANLASFLVSDDATNITGAIMLCDGGLMANLR